MILLDTCVLLWLAIDQSALSDKARQTLQSGAGHLYVSPISAFEIGQKVSRGKLILQLPPERWFLRAKELHGLSETSFDSSVAFSAAALPDLHRDPFDRLLIATALVQNLTLLTPDPLIHRYPALKTVW